MKEIIRNISPEPKEIAIDRFLGGLLRWGDSSLLAQDHSTFHILGKTADLLSSNFIDPLYRFFRASFVEGFRGHGVGIGVGVLLAWIFFFAASCKLKILQSQFRDGLHLLWVDCFLSASVLSNTWTVCM